MTAFGYPSAEGDNPVRRTGVSRPAERRRTTLVAGPAEVPDGIVLKRDRDLDGRANEIWIRRGLFALLPLISVLALLNVFGQRPTTRMASAGAATLEVHAPPRVRGGLIYQARFRIRAESELQKATLVLGPGWLESMTVNTIEPAPVGEASDDGKLSLELGHIPAGSSYVLFMEFQTNPTNVGRRSAPVTLLDGDEQLVQLDRTVTIFP
jgi:hypothetical protein